MGSCRATRAVRLITGPTGKGVVARLPALVQIHGLGYSLNPRLKSAVSCAPNLNYALSVPHQTPNCGILWA